MESTVVMYEPVLYPSIYSASYNTLRYIYIYTPLPGQPPMYIFHNQDITEFKKLNTAIGFLNSVISLPKYGKLRRFYLEGGQFSLHLGQLEWSGQEHSMKSLAFKQN